MKRGVVNGLILAGGGLAVLTIRGLLLNPVSRYLLAAAAAVLGISMLVGNRKEKAPAFISLAAAAALLVLGGILKSVTGLLGGVLLAGGAVSVVLGLVGGRKGPEEPGDVTPR